MRNIQKCMGLISCVTFSALLMSAVDGIVQPSYTVKSMIKILLFSIVPLGYFCFHRDEIGLLKKIFRPSRKDLLLAGGMGLLLYGGILGGYFLLRDFIDLSVIRETLASGMGVTRENFVGVAIYISFVNSFLEEFFFRGFAFILLREKAGRGTAYLFSSLMFAVYHAGMTAGWFHWGIYLLAMGGLFAGGCIFSFMNEKSRTIYPSWMVHICANFAINTVGLMLFDLI